MKFRIITTELDEDLNSGFSSFFGETKYRTSNAKGAKIFTKPEQMIDAGLKVPTSNNDYYILHHINRNHTDNRQENRILILNSMHSKLHQEALKNFIQDEELTDADQERRMSVSAKLQKMLTQLLSCKDDLEVLLKDENIQVVIQDIQENLQNCMSKLVPNGKELENKFKDYFKKFFEKWLSEQELVTITLKHKHKNLNGEIKTLKSYTQMN